MLMPKRRFQFNNTYLYGSGAFVLGFGAVLATLVHFAPIRVTDATVSTNNDVPAAEQEAAEQSSQSEPTPAAQDAPAVQFGTAMMQQPLLMQPTSPAAPTVSAPAPSQPTQPTIPDPVPVVEVPTTPVVPTDPLPTIPLPLPGSEDGDNGDGSLIDLNLLGLKVEVGTE